MSTQRGAFQKETRLFINKLDKILLQDNDLTNLEVIDTSLNNIDLSSNKITGIRIDLKDIKNASISINQMYDLINLLGVNIK